MQSPEAVRYILIVFGIMLFATTASWLFIRHDTPPVESTTLKSSDADTAPTAPVKATTIPASPLREQGSVRPPEDPALTLRTLLFNEKFDEAVELYERIYQTGRPQAIAAFRQQILRHARDKMMVQNRTLLLEPLAKLFYQDIDINMTLAYAYRKQQDYLKEIETLYGIFPHVYEQAMVDELKQRIQTATEDFSKSINNRLSAVNVLRFYEAYVSTANSSNPVRLLLADKYLRENRLREARDILTPAIGDELVGEEALTLLSLTESGAVADPDGTGGIPLTPLGRGHFAVDAVINRHSAFRLMIDTGASISILKPRAFSRLGGSVTSKGQVRVNTANGPVNAPVHRLEGITVGNQSVSPVTIATLDLDGLADVDGLLGMDYLKHFRFTFDQQNNQLFLTPLH